MQLISMRQALKINPEQYTSGRKKEGDGAVKPKHKLFNFPTEMSFTLLRHWKERGNKNPLRSSRKSKHILQYGGIMLPKEKC